MGRSPCCSKEGLNRGAWTALEDRILTAYIKAHGEGKWKNLPKRAGLKRCGKSCRLRWLNYLRPDIKRGNISNDEEELIIRLHNLLGNRWSLIAGRLPGRTDNEIKNYWNTTLAKKAKAQQSSSNPPSPSPSDDEPKTSKRQSDSAALTGPKVIRTKASRCTRVVVSGPITIENSPALGPSELQAHRRQDNLTNPPENLAEGHNFPGTRGFTVATSGGNDKWENDTDNFSVGDLGKLLSSFDDNWAASSDFLEVENAMLDLDSLSMLLESDEWP